MVTVWTSRGVDGVCWQRSMMIYVCIVQWIPIILTSYAFILVVCFIIHFLMYKQWMCLNLWYGVEQIEVQLRSGYAAGWYVFFITDRWLDLISFDWKIQTWVVVGSIDGCDILVEALTFKGIKGYIGMEGWMFTYIIVMPCHDVKILPQYVLDNHSLLH